MRPHSFKSSSFSSYKNPNLSLSSYFETNSDLSSSAAPDDSLSQLIDKLDKQDSTTKLKSAEAIVEVLKKQQLEDYRLEKFLFVFRKLALVEPDPSIRIALAEILQQYFIISKKAFQPYLKSNYFIIKSCIYDDIDKVANSYLKALSILGDDKIFNNIYNFIKEDLPIHIKFVLKHFPDYLKKWKFYLNIPSDQQEKCYSRLITAFFKFVYYEVPLDGYLPIWSVIDNLVWEFLGFSAFKTTTPNGIRIVSLTLIEKAIDANVDYMPKNDKLMCDSLKIFYNSEGYKVAVMFLNLFLKLSSNGDKGYMLKFMKKLLVEGGTFRDGRYANAEYCNALVDILVNDEELKGQIPKFIQYIQNPESISRLVIYHGLDSDILVVLVDKIRSVLKSRPSRDQLIVLASLIELLEGAKLNGNELDDVLNDVDHEKDVNLIPAILRLNKNFGRSNEKIIDFVISGMIPGLILLAKAKYNNVVYNRLVSALEVFEKCKEFIGKGVLEFETCFKPLSLTVDFSLSGLENRISLDIKIIKCYYRYLHLRGVRVDIIAEDSEVSSEVIKFWVGALGYLAGLCSVDSIVDAVHLLIPEGGPFINALVANEIKLKERFFDSCYKAKNYEIASLVSYSEETHLDCLKAGYLPNVSPVSYTTLYVLESLMQYAIGVCIPPNHELVFTVLYKQNYKDYIEVLYSIIVGDGIERLTFEQLKRVAALIRITIGGKSCGKMIALLFMAVAFFIEPDPSLYDSDMFFFNDFVLMINIGDDLPDIVERFSKCRLYYKEFFTLSDYVFKKLSWDGPELGNGYLKLKEGECDEVLATQMYNALGWLVPLSLLDDNLTFQSPQFKYLLDSFIKAIYEANGNSTYYMLRFLENFFPIIEKAGADAIPVDKLKMSYLDYIKDFAQIISLISSDEFSYDGRCFVLSLFNSVQALEKVSYVNELREYLEKLDGIDLELVDVLVGSKDRSVIEVGLGVFLTRAKDAFKLDNFDYEIELEDNDGNNDNFILKKSYEYQCQLELKYPNLLKIILGYVDSLPSLYLMAWDILFQSITPDSLIAFPNYDQLDIFMNEVMVLYNNDVIINEVERFREILFDKFPRYVLDRAKDSEEFAEFFEDLSGELIKKEVELMNKWKITASHRGLTISGLFKVEDMQPINFKIHLSKNYPFDEATLVINKDEIQGISKKQAHYWLESSRELLKLGKVALAVKNIRENITQYYKGVSECNICLAAFHTESKTLVNKKCQVCKSVFHSFCIFRWFRTSHKPKCPICQSHATIAFPRRYTASDNSVV